MNNHYLHSGLHLILHNEHYIIDKIIEDSCYLQKSSSNQQIILSMEDAHKLIKSGEIVFANPPEQINAISYAGFDPKANQLITLRYKYVYSAYKTLITPTRMGLEDLIHNIALQENDPNPPTPITLYRWWTRWIESGKKLSSLANKKPGTSNQQKQHPVINNIFHEVIEKIYLTKERNSKQDVYSSLKFQINQYNIKNPTQILAIPSRATVYRMIAQLDKHTVISAREGKKVADKLYRTSYSGIETYFPLERVEIDHTPLDVIVVDDEGIPIGRPYLTCMLDVYTRIPMALEIDFEPPSELSVMKALKQAIYPKDTLLKNYVDIKQSWPIYGIPHLLVCDNGLEFHSKQLQRVCNELNIELFFCPKHQPHYKGAVERFLGTLNRQVSQKIAGTTFSNITMRGEYNSVQSSTITLKKLRELIYFWAVEIYMQNQHRTLNTSPYKKFQAAQRNFEPLLPESPEMLHLICAKEYVRRLSHEGIIFRRLFYNSEVLRNIRIFKGNRAKVIFRVDVQDLGKIWVLDEEQNLYIEVPATKSEYATGLTLFQHNHILQQKRNLDLSEHQNASLEQAQEKLREKIHILNTDKRIKKRIKGARLGTIKNNPTQPDQPSKQQPTTSPSLNLESIPDFDIISRGTGHA
ncbi:hypothetical protein B9T12_09010 [Wohlfahrtiimonas chitiniclastica]|uniref:Mu transposase C-terminal domain-containing protein n=1 Tax=Wohlfahrtiimonas chitiniclastica TaxID=400946 RepID=UPI000B97DB81|nr:DDE-type integrase/transposase/recombinase [Wohlfahrtiimonas chitiniclastica]OYQ77102.1 hypothetical protein B9T12_09010 [Wohlfahrtiimonas chitiniclastica]